MRQPELKWKVHSHCIEEIYKSLHAQKDAQNDLKFQGHKAAVGNILVAYVLWCLVRSPAERERIAREMIAFYEQLCESDEPQDLTRAFAEFAKERGFLTPESTNLPGASFQQTFPITGAGGAGGLDQDDPPANGKTKHSPDCKRRVGRKKR